MKDLKAFLFLILFISTLPFFSNSVFAIPTFSSLATVNNNTEYSPGKDFSIQINITDDVCGIECIVNATFETNLTTGLTTLQNFTKQASQPNPTNYLSNNTVGIWWVNFTQEQTAGAGTYVFKWYAHNGTTEAADSQYIFIILQNSTNPVNLYLNGTLNDNKTYTYPEAINATAEAVYSNSGTLYLYRDGNQVASGTGSISEQILLGNGTYAYKVNITGNQNYTSNLTGATYYAFVLKGILILSITPDQTVIYPSTTTVTGTENNIGDSDVTYQLWRDSTPIVSQTNPGSLSESILLGAASYTYRFNATGGANWTANSTGLTSTLTVSQGTPTPSIYLNDLTQNLTINWTDSYTVKGNWSSLGGDSDLIWNLYRNGTPIATGNPAINDTQLGNATYVFVYNTSGGQNWTSAQTQQLYLYVLKRWNQTNNIIAGAQYPYDLNVLGIPIAKQELARIQDSSQVTSVNGNAYSVIPINVTWNSSAYISGDTTTFTNVNVSLSSCPSGWTCNLYSWIIPVMNNTYQTTNTTNSTMNKTDVVVSLAGGNNDWIQDTTKTTIANSTAFIKGNIRANNTDTIDYSNVNFPADQTNQYRTGWSCTQASRTIASISALSTWSSTDYPTLCNKENVIQINVPVNDWQQDNLYATTAGGLAYIEGNANYTNTDPLVSYSNVRINATGYNSSLARPGWTCSFNNSRYSDLSFASLSTNRTTNYPIQCSAQNIIQPVNTSDWVQDQSQVTFAGGYAYIKGKSYFNNTDSISYSNVVANLSSYHNETLRRDSTWLCSWNSSFEQTDLSFSAGKAVQVSGYSVLCNKSNVITKTDQAWQADNSTEQTIAKQWIIKKVNGTNTDSIDYFNVNYTIAEFPGCKAGYTCNETTALINLLAGQSWERWINATNASEIIKTTWTNYWNASTGIYYQNIAINETDAEITFYNLTAWTLNFNDTNITAGTESLKFWNGTLWEDITPAINQTDCNTTNPTYTAKESVSNGTFYVCKQDLDGNGRIDYFKFKLPHTSIWYLQAGGSDITKPTITSFTLSSTSIYIGNSITISWSTTDNVGISSVKITADGTILTTTSQASGSISWTPPQTGTYTIKLEVLDTLGNSNSAILSLSVLIPYIPERPKIEVNTTPGKGSTYISFIKADEQATVSFEKRRDLNVFELNILVKNRVNSVRITITKLDKKPAEVEVEVTGKAYRYFDVKRENIRDEDISKAKIKFLVERSWINANNINPNTIALYRWANNSWNKLATTKLSEDADYIYYEAETPGFSYFAVSGEVAKQACPFECCVGEVAYYDKPCVSGYECRNRVCVALAPKCICTDWSNVGCGVSPCKENEMKQTRSCTPAGCNAEERCITDPACAPLAPPAIPSELAIGIVVIIILIIGVLVWKLKTFKF